MSDAITALALRIAGAAIAFALQVVFARLMAAEDYGHFATFWAWLLGLGSLAPLGMSELAIRLLPRYSHRGRNRELAGFWRTGLHITLIASVLMALAIAAIAAAVPGSTEVRTLVMLLAIAVPLISMEFYLGSIARAMGWAKLGIVLVFVVRPALLLALVAILWWGSDKVTSATVVAALISTLMVSVAVLLWVTRGRLAPGGAGQSKPRRNKWLSLSWPMAVASTLDDLLNNADMMIVGLLNPAAAAATYFVASRVLTPAALVQYAFTYVAPRRFSLSLAGAVDGNIRTVFRHSLARSTFSAAAALLLILAASPLLLRIFGEHYDVGFSLILLLAVAQLARGVSAQSQELLQMTGRLKSLNAINAASLAIMVLAVTVLAALAGIHGAAVACAAAMLIRAAVLLWHCWRRIDRHVPNQVPARQGLSLSETVTYL